MRADARFVTALPSRSGRLRVPDRYSGGVATHRYAAALASIRFEAFEPQPGQRLEAKTSAQRGLSRRPHWARPGLRRARAHRAASPSRASKTKTARSVRETALSRTRRS